MAVIRGIKHPHALEQAGHARADVDRDYAATPRCGAVVRLRVCAVLAVDKLMT